MALLETLTIIIGGIVFLIVPGYALSEILFRRGEVDLMERIAATLVLGILATPTIMLILNKTIRMRITALNTSLVVLVILAYTILYVAYLKRRFRGKEAATGAS